MSVSIGYRHYVFEVIIKSTFIENLLCDSIVFKSPLPYGEGDIMIIFILQKKPKLS